MKLYINKSLATITLQMVDTTDNEAPNRNFISAVETDSFLEVAGQQDSTMYANRCGESICSSGPWRSQPVSRYHSGLSRRGYPFLLAGAQNYDTWMILATYFEMARWMVEKGMLPGWDYAMLIGGTSEKILPPLSLLLSIQSLRRLRSASLRAFCLPFHAQLLFTLGLISVAIRAQTYFRLLEMEVP